MATVLPIGTALFRPPKAGSNFTEINLAETSNKHIFDLRAGGSFMENVLLRNFRKVYCCAYSGVGAAITGAAVLLMSALAAQAQSFFSTIVIDPVAGVDRGSASQIQKLDKPTLFLTFDTYGSEDIGKGIASLGYVLPDAFSPGDQLDIVGVIGGPSEDGGEELLAAGISYRFTFDDGRTYLFARADHGDIILGTPENLAISAQGSRTNAAVGLRRTIELKKKAKLITSVELAGRHGAGEILGFPVIDEDLRLVRASMSYEQGVPMLFQRRFAAAVTKGFDGFGASPVINPGASNPGASTDFLRVSFSAETSVPLSPTLVTNIGIIGQWSEERLPLSQRCGYGTNSYARGFDQSFVNGDQCLGTRAELAYNIEIPDPSADKLTFTQAYLGVDFGWIKDNPAPFSAGSDDNWSSGSIGVRSLRGDFIGEASVTRILDQPASPYQQDQTRLWLRAGVKF